MYCRPGCGKKDYERASKRFTGETTQNMFFCMRMTRRLSRVCRESSIRLSPPVWIDYCLIEIVSLICTYEWLFANMTHSRVIHVASLKTRKSFEKETNWFWAVEKPTEKGRFFNRSVFFPFREIDRPKTKKKPFLVVTHFLKTKQSFIHS